MVHGVTKQWDSTKHATCSVLQPPDAKNWLTGKDPDAGQDGGQEEKGTTEDEMVGWHHWLDGHGFGQAPGVSDGWRSLACSSLCGGKELDTAEQLNWTELNTHAHTQPENCRHFVAPGMWKVVQKNKENFSGSQGILQKKNWNKKQRPLCRRQLITNYQATFLLGLTHRL